jgi:hypothetical protein
MIMYGIEIVVLEDAPPQRPWDSNESLGKRVGLLLCLCMSIYSRGFVMIVCSGFCVLQGIVKLRKNSEGGGNTLLILGCLPFPFFARDARSTFGFIGFGQLEGTSREVKPLLLTMPWIVISQESTSRERKPLLVLAMPQIVISWQYILAEAGDVEYLFWARLERDLIYMVFSF